MRQKKLTRHQQTSTQTEQLITQLTSRRSQLFEALENEVQRRTGPAHDSKALESISSPSHRKSKSVMSLESELSGGSNDDYGGSDADENQTDQPDVQQTLEVAAPKKQIDEPDISKLREEAAYTDKCLQHERNYLHELRASLASNLARLDQLEVDLCKHSESWEMEEKERLSIDSTPEATMKRKRTEESFVPTGIQTKKVMVRAMETIAVLGLGAGIDAARRAYM